MQLVGSLWFVPVLVLVGISLFATFAAGALVCAVLAVVAMTVIGLIRRRSSRVGAGRSAPYIEQLQSFGYTLLHIFVVLFFIEVALRVWGMSLIRYAEGEGEQISMKVVSFGTTCWSPG